ncbi:hypothetical protein P375_11400 [Gallibacterium genomosp. 2]|uniref:Antitoxin SocA-like Panacea domain-containing protein n=1 Tax=Gallibacterium genomosp. 2 TaxID=155517 RepID=A0A0A2XC52_9PAST|nr:type II toxin-antitoxin system antitoxin SocA domain-containing protein [Gallibacterium genomosp. 2]KGQ30006.1 hypothetical protein P375_11400 [Gallibacterium genomosp. 2]
MAYSAKAIANAIIERARAKNIFDISPMKLQKLLFYAQSWNLRVNNQVLFDDPIERWNYGPVVRDVYHEFKNFGDQPITLFATDALGYIPIIKPDDENSWLLIDKILDVYGKYDALQLSNMTHAPDTAWSKGNIGTFISTEELNEGTL